MTSFNYYYLIITCTNIYKRKIILRKKKIKIVLRPQHTLLVDFEMKYYLLNVTADALTRIV